MNSSKLMLRAIVAVLVLAGQILVTMPGRSARAEGNFVVNTAADDNAKDAFLSLREALSVANGTLSTNFSNGEKEALGGCAFTGSDGGDAGNPAAGTWNIDLAGPGCGAGITDTIYISLPVLSGNVLTLTSALPNLNDSAPTMLSGLYSGSPDFELMPTIDASNVTASDGLRLISNGNQIFGVKVRGAQGNGIRIDGNGNTVSMTSVYSNSQAGIAIYGDRNQFTAIIAGHSVLTATTCDGKGNSGSGVFLASGANANQILQLIGVCNGNAGIEVLGPDTSGNLIGEAFLGTTTMSALLPVLPNARGLFAHAGVTDLTVDGLLAQNNTVGVDLDASSSMTLSRMFVMNNVERGIYATNVHTAVLGGGDIPNQLQSNLIGIELYGSSNWLITNTTVMSNAIGITLRGSTTQNVAVYQSLIQGQSGDGILVIDGAANNQIGIDLLGDASPCSNSILNNQRGVRITSVGTNGNTVRRNCIGVAPAAENLGNRGDGILIENRAADNLVIANTISGNAGAGVRLASGATNNGIRLNRIGLGMDLTAFMPNADGVVIEGGAHDNFIGPAPFFACMACAAARSPAGSNDEQGNQIGGNSRSGVTIDGAGTRDNVVATNSIYSNTLGIAVTGGATGTLISRARVYANLSHGIVFSGTGTSANRVANSSTYSNGGDGINEQAGAGGNTWNTMVFGANSGLGVDKDAGPDSSNTPDAILPALTQVTVGGLLSGTASPGALVEIYTVADEHRDSFGYGEGEYFDTITATASGAWSVATGASACYAAVQTVSGASSEFSLWRCTQVLTFTAPSTAYVGITRALTISVSSGLSVSVVSATPAICSVTGTIVTPFARGVCELSAAAVVSVNYFPVAPVTQRIAVRLGAHEIMMPLVRR